MAVAGGCHEGSSTSSTTTRSTTTQPGNVRFTGTIYPRRYNTRDDRAQGHHAIVWREGRNARKALIEANVSDVEIQDELEALGWKPGDNLSSEAWTERDDDGNPHPDRQVKGPRLSVSLTWEGRAEPLTLADALGEDEDTVEIRFGGHRRYIARWKSGCVTCMFSCPGGRTSNAAFTLRDQARRHHAFHADESLLPADGTTVEVWIGSNANATLRQEDPDGTSGAAVDF